MKFFKKIILAFLVILFAVNCSYATTENLPPTPSDSWLQQTLDYFSPYKPNYILPAYYSDKLPPATNNPGASVVHNEMKFHISIKADLLNAFWDSSTHLYLAYTQLSFWQQYTTNGFVRENNYEPELFLTHLFSQQLQKNYIESITTGYDHESNGAGGDQERSWERLYVDMHFGDKNWLISIKPWVRITGVLEHAQYNSDIGRYLGYERILLAYKYKHNVFSLMLRNTVESLFRRSAIEATWSFPIYKNIHGFADFFSGYGQSLSEYNHYNNSVGIGISLSDWL